jgi:hypothetical protein
MTNVIPFTSSRPIPKIPALPTIDLDDDELNIRLWELAMSGQRATQEFRRLESEIAARNPFARPSNRLF